jgi:hypothetical protein
MAALLLVCLAVAAWRFGRDGFLPQPFYYRVADSLLDLHNAAYWAHDGKAYERWGALYPPLSFVFLRLVSITSCYRDGALAGRACDRLSELVLLGFYALNLVLVFLTYRKADPRTAAPRTVAMAAGLPMLYALERGNLLIPCFTCFVLGYGDLLQRGWRRWLAFALAINFKPYLALVALPFLAARRWLWLAGCAACALGVYLATLWLYGSGWPWQVIASDAHYAVAGSRSRFSDVYFATSFWPLIRLLQDRPAWLAGAAAWAGPAALVLTLAVRLAQAASLGCLIAAAFRPARVEVRRLGALTAGLAITAFTTGSAGYAQIFVLFLVLFEPWRGALRGGVLLGAYLLCLPVDLVLVHGPAQSVVSYLSGRSVVIHPGLSVGHLLRPAVLLAMQFGLVALNARDLWGRAPDAARTALEGSVAAEAPGRATAPLAAS